MIDLHCANTMAELADLWCRMDAHEGQAAWAGAAGSFAAVLVAVGLALQTYREDLNRRRAAGRAAVHHALNTACMLESLLVDATEKDTSDPKMSSQQATMFMRSGRMREVMRALDELRPQDLHGPSSARAWVTVRVVGRDLESRLSELIDVPGSAGILAMRDLTKNLEKPLVELRRSEKSKRPRRLRLRDQVP
jgi:hypothetical protein